MRKYLFIFFLPIATLVKAQTVLEEQFQFNFLALNPAMTGARENFSLNGMFGNQFNGTLRPQQVYQLFSMDGTIQQGKGGLGLQAYNSNVRGFDNAGAKLSYAYREQFRNGLTLSAGANAGFIYQPLLLGTQGSRQMNPYLGLGGLVSAKQFYLGVSRPVLLISDGVYNTKKPFYTMIGGSLGEPENVMLNVTGTVESNKGEKTNVYITAKVWFIEQVGLGFLFRSETHIGRKVNKIIPMAEFQIGESFRLGGSYDFKPLAYPSTASQEIFQQRGIFQLYLRYEFLGEYGSSSRMKYY